MTPEQHDSYLFWRLMHGGKIKFPHIRVEDKIQIQSKIVMYIAGAIGVATISALTYGCISQARKECENKGNSQRITCINRSPAGQQHATEDKKDKIDDPSESSTSSSIIIESVDSTTEDPEDAEVRIDIETQG